MARAHQIDEAVRARCARRGWRPQNCVWELTLACNLRCKHCGSSAGAPRDDELSTAECLDVVAQLDDLGCELVTLSGGEPTLRPDWDVIGRAVADRGIYVNMVTNGVYRSGAARREVARRALDAGLCNVGVSIDGTEQVHNFIRGNTTFEKAIESVERFAAMGLKVAVLTTVNRLNLASLPLVRQIAIDAGATQWRLQLAKPMGNLGAQRDLVIPPQALLSLLPSLAQLKRAGGIHLHVGDSIGYYGKPDKVLRSRGWRGNRQSWQGCQAGLRAVGIEADGGVKGCLSLQAKLDGRDPFVEGNLRQSRLAEIWWRPGLFAYNREFAPESLTGGCRDCKVASVCRGGARCVSAAFCGHLGEDPYCYYRLLEERQKASRGGLAHAARSAACALAISIGGLGCQGPDEAPAEEATQARDVGRDARVDLRLDLAGRRPSSDADRVDADGDGRADPVFQPEYGVEPDGGQSDAADARDVSDRRDEEPVFQPEYGVLPDAGQPDVADTGDASDARDEEPVFQPEYGVLPDASWLDARDTAEDSSLADAADASADSPDAIHCGDVCCECDYGVIPDEVWEACCVRDPCEGVCCDCEYGIIPDDLWAQCCDPCADVCCMCDYGVIPDELWAACCDPCADVCCDCDYGEPPPPECCD